MTRKHFIAGARCPQCNAEDRVRFCRDGEREWIECVACGHASDKPPAPEHPQPGVEAAERVVRLQPGK
ncbi:MAG: YheV family putative zinc ribbon protein [Pseudomonadota bacterium]